MKLYLRTLIVLNLVCICLSPYFTNTTNIPSNDNLVPSYSADEDSQPTLRPIEKDLSENIIGKLSNTAPTLGKILFDKTKHDKFSDMYMVGPVSVLGGYLSKIGYECDYIMNGTLNATFLADYDVLVIHSPQLNFTQQEILDIRQYVNNGGNLILVSFPYKYPNYYLNTYFNSLTETFGIHLNDQLNSVSITPSSNYPVFTNVSSFTLTTNTAIVGPSVTAILNATSGETLMGNTTYGNGKIFFFCDDLLFRNIQGINSNQNLQFAVNLFNWITDNPLQQTVYPDFLSIELFDYALSAEEISKYQLYSVDFHSHCKQGSSDGSSLVADQLQTYVNRYYDAMTLTDHTSDYATLAFPHADNYYQTAQLYENDFLWIPGLELSYIPHHTAFPTTTQIKNPDNERNLTNAINFYHGLNAVVFRAHPLLDPNAESVPEFYQHETYGLDGFEVFNSGFFGDHEGGIGEWAYEMPFVSGSDAHGVGSVGRGRTFVFAENLTIPSIVDAILNRRVVAYGDFQDYFDDQLPIKTFVGDKVWMDEFFKWKDMATQLNITVVNKLSELKTAGWNSSLITESEDLVEQAAEAMSNLYHSYGKAYRLLQKAIANLFTLSCTFEPLNLTEEDQTRANITLIINLKNGLGEAVQNLSLTAQMFKRSVLDDFNAEIFANVNTLTALNGTTVMLNTSGLQLMDYRLKLTVQLPNTYCNATITLYLDSNSWKKPPPVTSSSTSSSSGQPTPSFEWLIVIPAVIALCCLKNKKTLFN